MQNFDENRSISTWISFKMHFPVSLWFYNIIYKLKSILIMQLV